MAGAWGAGVGVELYTATEHIRARLGITLQLANSKAYPGVGRRERHYRPLVRN